MSAGLSRRGALCGLTAATVAAAAPATKARGSAPGPTAIVHPDAELLRLASEFQALDHRYAAIVDATDDDAEQDALLAPVCEAQDALLPCLLACRATTLEGIRARAACVVLFAPDYVWALEDSSHTDALLIGALLRDLAGDMLQFRLRACDRGALPAIAS